MSLKVITRTVDLDRYLEYREFIKACEQKQYDSNLVLHKHHIIPKAISNNDKRYMKTVLLSVEDHVQAHLMMAKCFDEGSYEWLVNVRAAKVLKKKSITDKEVLKVLYDNQRGEKNPFFGKKHNAATLAILSKKTTENLTGVSYEKRYGATRAADEKKKRSEGVCKSHQNMTKEKKAQRSASLSKALKGRLVGAANPCSIQVKVNGKIFGSIAEACRCLRVTDYKLFKYYKVEKLSNENNSI